MLNPALVVCDEPISSLDVSIQAQILNLLAELQETLGLTYLFIAHDLAAVAYVCDRVAVMYLGRIVEIGTTRDVYFTPRHPYTEALMSAVPEPDPDAPLRPILLEGERPDPANPPSGCRFRTRCRYATDLCAAEVPPLRELSERAHRGLPLCRDAAAQGRARPAPRGRKARRRMMALRTRGARIAFFDRLGQRFHIEQRLFGACSISSLRRKCVTQSACCRIPNRTSTVRVP